jgi:RNA polymerase sigma factor (sigma-70 family)
MAEQSDRAAIAASIDDPRAFVVVFERHFDAIFRYLRRRVGRDRAEELAAETFTTAFASRHRFDSRAADARPWLYGIAVNLLRHHYRTEERELRAHARSAVDPLRSEEVELDRIDAASAARVAGAIAELAPSEREVLLLYAWAELSYREIAEALGVPVGTVRSRLSRARRRIRELLAASGQYVGGPADG